eukprot:CAMPEP_0114488552 /NCGR_PEP_ID=MMETSP0109-20121206/1395_1 /TAXON_ID=29199 /ORGANISM="Chlorarachnion reptans, Strain CCCM449" /LENGTH=230 /DNA_ID=CAMNT_0001664961 /DNA_START=333 /DNA_END=1025 /DNA_ORIENTATION=+
MVTSEVIPSIASMLKNLRLSAQTASPATFSKSGGGDDLKSVKNIPGIRRNKYTLILDLDETLVHTARSAISGGAHCRLEIYNNRNCRAFYVYKRPYLAEFLYTMSQYYEIVIFTASVRQYADPLIDILDSDGVVSRRYFRDSCIERNGTFVKDLSRIVPKGLERTVIIDNSPVAYSMNKDNAVPIRPFYDDASDDELRSCIPFLMALRSMKDVRKLLRRRHRKQDKRKGH